MSIEFKIERKIKNRLGRSGTLITSSGKIETPAFVPVATKATVKSLTPEHIKELGAEIILANTYHLYLQPGPHVIKEAGGLSKFMNWNGPTITDSGGFQAFSLGVAYGSKLTKLAKAGDEAKSHSRIDQKKKMAIISEDGVEFQSILDGSKHKFTPEKSIEIQNSIGADIIFAFDECTSPHAERDYQKEATNRTFRWAKRSLDAHRKNDPAKKQALFGIAQGGRFKDLREVSAKEIGRMDFEGFGIGGSFDKDDIDSAVSWVNQILPEEKPRHLLGIGEPADLFGAIENGCDLFDCVAPTRNARNGSLYTSHGPINIENKKFVKDFNAVDENCLCYTCSNYTRSYLSHLFRSKEILANTLASIHNLYFIVKLVKNIRKSILDATFPTFKENFLTKYEFNR